MDVMFQLHFPTPTILPPFSSPPSSSPPPPLPLLPPPLPTLSSSPPSHLSHHVFTPVIPFTPTHPHSPHTSHTSTHPTHLPHTQHNAGGYTCSSLTMDTPPFNSDLKVSLEHFLSLSRPTRMSESVCLKGRRRQGYCKTTVRWRSEL